MTSGSGETAEQAMRRVCDSIMQGDYLSPMNDLTAEAMNEIMTIGAGLTGIQAPQRYVIEGHEEQGDEHRFRVRFTLPDREIVASASWRNVGGAWKIAAINVEA